MTGKPLDLVRAAVTGTLWAIEPNKLDAILEFLSHRLSGERLTVEEIQARIGDKRPRAASQAVGNIAVLPLHGTIAHRMGAMTETSGGASTEQFAQWFDAAMADDSVGAVVIDIDSPGGSTTGIEELASKIHAARGRKPIIAVANGMAASAAYWLGAAADEFVASPSALVGSIGVFAVHEDATAKAEREGVKVTYIKAGRYKAEGNPFEPLTDDARAATQQMVDDMYGTFVGALAKFRGTTRADVEASYGQGRVLLARRALSAGMIDRVATLDDVLADLSSGQRTTRGRTRAEAGLSIAAECPPTSLTLEAVDYQGRTAEDCAARFVGTTGTSNTPIHIHIDFTPSAATEGAAGVAVPEPLNPAPAATEQTMPESTAANDAAPTRAEMLADLAATHGKDAQLGAWIKSGKSVDAIREDLLAGYRTAAAASHVNTSGTTPIVTGGIERAGAKPFASLGEQLMAVVGAAAPGGHVDPRLYGAASGGSAAVGADGGFLIQKDFAVELMSSGFQQGELASRCSETEVGAQSDGLEVKTVDETSRATGSRWGGVRVYRVAEAETVAASRAKLQDWSLRLEDLMGVAYMTDRLMQDASAMESVYREAFNEEFGFVLDDEIFRGTGAGQCQGVLTAGCAVSVAKETSQAAATINALNIIKMWARVHPRSKARGAWFINTECETQMPQLAVLIKNVAGTENVGGVPIYQPASIASGSPYGALYGRPVVPIEHAEALGTKGDISFLDLSQYKLIRKGGIDAQDSIHVRFLYNERTFKWTARVNGKPKLKSAITPYKGSSTLSPFVFLDTRA